MFKIKSIGLLLLMNHLAYSFPFFALILSAAGGISLFPSLTEPVKCILGECCANAVRFDAESRKYFNYLF